MTIDDLRGRLRIELHDEDSGSYRWSDATLDRHLQRATRELSLASPLEQKTGLSTSAGSRDLDASGLTSLVRVYAVEYPVGLYPACYVAYSLFAETLTLLVEQAPGAVEDVNVYWGKLHTLDDSSSTLPLAAEDAVVTGASAYAAIEWSSFATNRANVGGSEVVRQYAAYGEAQLRRFTQALARFGDRGRLQTSSLFVPARPAVSQSAVGWEL